MKLSMSDDELVANQAGHEPTPLQRILLSADFVRTGGIWPCG